MLHYLSSSRLEGIKMPENPLREIVGFFFINITKVSLPEPSSKSRLEDGINESHECANALRTEKFSCMALEHSWA